MSLFTTPQKERTLSLIADSYIFIYLDDIFIYLDDASELYNIARREGNISYKRKNRFIYITFMKPYHYILKNQIRHLPRKGRLILQLAKYQKKIDFILFSCWR